MSVRNWKDSKDQAKDRLKMLLLSERITCTPNLLDMMRNDIILSVDKYIPVNEENVTIEYNAQNNSIVVSISVKE